MVEVDRQTRLHYHRVVDCQWACPAHTDVPEYIRLIAAGKYADAYFVNRESNVFPGILGRVCDRPCEPACRRGRVDKAPVAICRLKRTAADLKGDISLRLPKPPRKKHPQRIALVGAGPASLTVANDLLLAGYSCTLFEKDQVLGGAMRTMVPAFRLPAGVLDEEIGYIVNMGLELRVGQRVDDIAGLILGFDGIFIGTGAPKGRDLPLPGRQENNKHICIGIDWLRQVSFAKVQQVQPEVLVIGGGNTAMDCARTAKRLGAQSVVVVAPESFEDMLASLWEKQDALEEGIEIINHLLPHSFIQSKDMLKVSFQPLSQCYNDQGDWQPVHAKEKPMESRITQLVILAIGQESSLPFLKPNLGIDCHVKTGLPIVHKETMQSSHPKVFFGGDAAFGPRNIIWAVAHGHQAALAMDSYFAQGRASQPESTMVLTTQRMGLHDWSYANAYNPESRQVMKHQPLDTRFDNAKTEVELGFTNEQVLKEAERCLNCDVQTVFQTDQCIECQACVDICPVDCLTILPTDETGRIAGPLTSQRQADEQPFYISNALPLTQKNMAKDENYCVHCGLCAERCPTGAWDMQKSTLYLPKLLELK